MSFTESVAGVRLLLTLATIVALAGCGPSEEATVEPAEPPPRPAKVPVTTASAEALALYREGLELADNLHILEANEKFAQAVEADPQFAMGHFRMAQTSQSAAAFFRAVGLAEDNAKHASEGEQLYIKALIAGAENDQQMQLELLAELMTLFPDDERTHMQVANYFTGQQKFADAVMHYTHATSRNPEFAAAYNMLGYAHRNNGNLGGAKDAFARYVELLPNEANPYDSYAELLLELGEYDESVENYRKALEINPNFLTAFAGITVARSLQGDADAALAAAAEMLAAARNDGQKQFALFRTVTSHLFAGDREAALAVSWQRLESGDPTPATLGVIREYMGDIEVVAGNAEAARGHYDAALEHRLASNLNDANKAQAERAWLFKSAVAAMVAGDHEALAARTAEYAAKAEADGTAFERMRIHELNGYLAAVEGDLEKSAAELAQANQLNPIVMYYAAYANVGLGNSEEARSLANRAAYRNVLSPNLPFFRREALELLAKLESE